MWCRMVAVALPKQDGDEAAFYQAKIANARFFVTRLLPETNLLFTTMTSGKASMMAMPAEMF
jgi:hypothetical protein